MKQIYEKKMREFKKILLSGNGYIRMSDHTQMRIHKRGYTKGDIVSCIMNGTVNEVQTQFCRKNNKSSFAYVIEGKDCSNNPIVVVLGEEGNLSYTVVTVMPPLDNRRFKDCIS